MDVQKFNYILCIAKHQNLTKAARELYISQPTLSKYLQKLERELDGKLFSRSGNCYTPTYLGRRYMNYAKKMLELSQDWEKELSDLNSFKEGELNIAFPLMRSSCMIPKILPIFHEKYPGVKVNFLEETYAIQERLLLDDQLDFAIFNEAGPHPKLTYETLLNEEILLLLAPDHPLAKCGIKRENCKHLWMDMKLLEKEPFILNFPDQTTGKKEIELFEKYEINPPVPFHSRNPQACALLSQQGLGACLIPETYVKNMHFEQKPACFSVGDGGVFSTLTIAYRKGAYLPSYARDFIKIAQENV
ncbi:MAG: LysR family transcriptional regulator [Lachnospiraceae bacterium]|nr:LysR family transcriptional regulator [Lachnospiraceae bacterium]